MENKFRNTFFRILGLYQFACGLWGMYTLAVTYTLLNFLFLGPLILLLLVSGGYLFIRVDQLSFNLSIVSNILQIFQFNLFGNGFIFATGVYFALALDTLDISNIYINYRLWTFMGYFLINSDDGVFLTAINFIPILIILFMTLFKRVKDA
ncbi:MAG: hypothetical protein K1X61_00290 [Chitinophagales bacterium]|nr:hypothetical protein [Chitinophagales bacterium]